MADTTNTENTGDPSVVETDSLESPATDAGQISAAQPATTDTTTTTAAKPTRKSSSGPKQLLRRINIYLLLFILVLVISGGVLIVTIMAGKKATQAPSITSQSIPTDTLNQLSKTNATVGDPKEVLNVQSNAVFAGKVLVRDSLDVAGPIHVNGSLNLPGITVSGDSTFDQVQVNKTLNIGGDASILGQLNVKKNLAVSGGGVFGSTVTAPQIATNQLQLLGDLVLTNHVLAGGSTPGRSGGGALGSGGTASVSGSDTAGSVNINTGGGPSGNSCFVTVNFTSRFSSTPHVVITPTNGTAAGVQYYVTKSTSGFSICTATAPPANASLTFDYMVLG